MPHRPESVHESTPRIGIEQLVGGGTLCSMDRQTRLFNSGLPLSELDTALP
jgi:hypothetical protein